MFLVLPFRAASHFVMGLVALHMRLYVSCISCVSCNISLELFYIDKFGEFFKGDEYSPEIGIAGTY